MITAEEFFRNKIKEQNPNKEVVTLSKELITAEQGMRWAHEFKQLHLHNVVGQSEQLKAEDKDLPFADYLEKWYKFPRYEKVYDRKDGKGTDTEDEVIKNYRRAFRL